MKSLKHFALFAIAFLLAFAAFRTARDFRSDANAVSTAPVNIAPSYALPARTASEWMACFQQH